jgi:hypothetical protein
MFILLRFENKQCQCAMDFHCHGSNNKAHIQENAELVKIYMALGADHHPPRE